MVMEFECFVRKDGKECGEDDRITAGVFTGRIAYVENGRLKMFSDIDTPFHISWLDRVGYSHVKLPTILPVL